MSTFTPAQAEQWLLSLELFGMRFGLERMRRLMTALDSPQESFRSVLNEEYGKAVARSGPGLGIADVVLQEMVRLQAGGK